MLPHVVRTIILFSICVAALVRPIGHRVGEISTKKAWKILMQVEQAVTRELGRWGQWEYQEFVKRCRLLGPQPFVMLEERLSREVMASNNYNRLTVMPFLLWAVAVNGGEEASKFLKDFVTDRWRFWWGLLPLRGASFTVRDVFWWRTIALAGWSYCAPQKACWFALKELRTRWEFGKTYRLPQPGRRMDYEWELVCMKAAAIGAPEFLADLICEMKRRNKFPDDSEFTLRETFGVWPPNALPALLKLLPKLRRDFIPYLLFIPSKKAASIVWESFLEGKTSIRFTASYPFVVPLQNIGFILQNAIAKSRSHPSKIANLLRALLQDLHRTDAPFILSANPWEFWFQYNFCWYNQRRLHISWLKKFINLYGATIRRLISCLLKSNQVPRQEILELEHLWKGLKRSISNSNFRRGF